MTGKYWTKKEIAKIKELNSKGYTPLEIASHFPERTIASVRLKLGTFGLKMVHAKSKIEYVPNALENKLTKWLRTHPATSSELADKYNVAPKVIKEAIGNLKREGYNLSIKDDSIQMVREGVRPEPYKIDPKEFFGGYPKKIYIVKNNKMILAPTTEFKFGAIADTHLGSKYERMDVLNALYDIFQKEGVKVVLHGGNYVDGEFRFNKYETHTRGFDEMIDYFIKEYPKRKGIITYFIDGDDHEGWWTQKQGLETGRVIEDRARLAGRDDLVYLGYQEADLILKAEKGKSLMRIIHGGGGTAYADSYATQKIAESYEPGEKPHILLVGHYHKNVYHTPRGIHVLQLGCTQGQTRFMRKNKLRACLGGYTVTINQAPTGEINAFTPKWHQFWSPRFYKSKITSK